MNDQVKKPTTGSAITGKAEDLEVKSALDRSALDAATVVVEPTPEPEPLPLPTAEDFDASPVHRGVHAWVAQYIQDSPISRNTEIYNYIMPLLPKLADMINEENKA